MITSFYALDWLQARTEFLWGVAAGLGIAVVISLPIIKMAVIDTLTSLPNRRAMDWYMKFLFWWAKFTKETFVVLYIDLNEFKIVNDEFDPVRRHDAGDDLLQLVAMRLRQNLKRRDMVARIGGDELVAILRHINTRETDAEAFVARVEGLRAVLRSPYKISGRMLKTSASVGYSMYPIHGMTKTALRQHADQEMYKEKERKPRTYWEAPIIHVINIEVEDIDV